MPLLNKKSPHPAYGGFVGLPRHAFGWEETLFIISLYISRLSFPNSSFGAYIPTFNNFFIILYWDATIADWYDTRYRDTGFHIPHNFPAEP